VGRAAAEDPSGAVWAPRAPAATLSGMTLVDLRTVETINVLGPTIQFITSPDGGGDAPCVMRGTIPPGVVVPLHSHADPETFFVLSGAVEALEYTPDGFAWLPVGAGDLFHVPGGDKHAWRNSGREPAAMLMTSTRRIGTFFREIAALDGSCPPSQETLDHFLATAERYGYWNATPEENAEVGLAL
jgi:quercetin dioxygenase-like cupin family protein